MMPTHEAVFLGLIKKGPGWTDEESPQLLRDQEAHQANIQRLFEMGFLPLSGPISDGGDVRGIFVYRTESIEEAQQLVDEDPHVKSGQLVVELFTLYLTKEKLAKIT